MRYVFLTLAILCGSAMAGTSLSYSAFVAHATALHAGQTRAEIIAALGKPDEDHAAYLGYSLAKLVGTLPVGTQAYYAAEIDLKNGRMFGPIKWAWIDTTGPAPGSH